MLHVTPEKQICTPRVKDVGFQSSVQSLVIKIRRLGGWAGLGWKFVQFQSQSSLSTTDDSLSPSYYFYLYPHSTAGK